MKKHSIHDVNAQLKIQYPFYYILELFQTKIRNFPMAISKNFPGPEKIALLIQNYQKLSKTRTSFDLLTSFV